MWGRLGPRFALEAVFLILLAVGLGLADLDWVVIVAVMAGGWALVSLIELIASRRSAMRWPLRQIRAEEAPAGGEPPPSPLPIETPAPPSAPAPGPAPLPAELPAPVEAAPAAEIPPAPAPEDTLEVAPPREPGTSSRRRWFRRRKEGEGEESVPEPPKHVRKIEPDDSEQRAPAESAEGH
jgi:hypothetical protein